MLKILQVDYAQYEVLRAKLEQEGLAVENTAKSDREGLWSQQDTPTRWAKVFGVSVDTIKRRFKDQTIRNTKLSARSYRVNLHDLPATHPESPHKSA